MRNLKLFVWEGVLTDYTDGMVCVLAKDLQLALDILRNEDSLAYDHIVGIPPLEITEPRAFVCWGGG